MLLKVLNKIQKITRPFYLITLFFNMQFFLASHTDLPLDGTKPQNNYPKLLSRGPLYRAEDIMVTGAYTTLHSDCETQYLTFKTKHKLIDEPVITMLKSYFGANVTPLRNELIYSLTIKEVKDAFTNCNNVKILSPDSLYMNMLKVQSGKNECKAQLAADILSTSFYLYINESGNGSVQKTVNQTSQTSSEQDCEQIFTLQPIKIESFKKSNQQNSENMPKGFLKKSKEDKKLLEKNFEEEKAIFESEIDKLKKTIQTLETEKENLNLLINGQGGDIKKYNQQLEQKINELNKNSNQEQSLKVQIESLSNEKKKLTKTNEDLRENIHDLSVKLQAKVDQIKRQGDDLAKQAEQLNNDNKKVEDLNKKIVSLKNEYEAVVNSIKAEKNNLQDELSKLKSKENMSPQEWEAKFQNHVTDMATFQSTIKTLTTEKNGLIAENTVYIQQVKDFNTLIKERNKDIQSLKEKLEKATAEKENLQQQIKNYTAPEQLAEYYLRKADVTKNYKHSNVIAQQYTKRWSTTKRFCVSAASLCALFVLMHIAATYGNSILSFEKLLVGNVYEGFDYVYINTLANWTCLQEIIKGRSN